MDKERTERMWHWGRNAFFTWIGLDIMWRIYRAKSPIHAAWQIISGEAVFYVAMVIVFTTIAGIAALTVFSLRKKRFPKSVKEFVTFLRTI